MQDRKAEKAFKILNKAVRKLNKLYGEDNSCTYILSVLMGSMIEPRKANELFELALNFHKKSFYEKGSE